MKVNNYVSKEEEKAEPMKTPFMRLMFWCSNLSILTFAGLELVVLYMTNLDTV